MLVTLPTRAHGLLSTCFPSNNVDERERKAICTLVISDPAGYRLMSRLILAVSNPDARFPLS